MTGKEAGHIDHASPLAPPPHANAVNPDALEVVDGTVHEQLEGWIPNLASDDEIRAALEKAFDYRGVDEPQAPVHPLIQIAPSTESLQETRA